MELLTACKQDQDGTSSVLIPLASSQQTCMTYTYFCVYSAKLLMMDKKNCPKHVELYSKNKFEKWFYYKKIRTVTPLRD